MNVLYVLRYYPTLSETFVVREINAMLAAGLRVEVVAIGERVDGRLATNPPEVPVLRPPRRRRGSWIARRTRHIHRVHAHFDGEASALAMEIGERLGVPFSITLHAVDLFKPNPGIVRRLRAADGVFTVCEHHQRWIQTRYGVRAELARCGVERGLEVAKPEREPARVVTVARDVPKKDLRRFRRAVGISPNWILSDIPHDKVRRRLLDSQVFALPCRVAPDGDRDGVPVSMLEAMAVGLPVVTRPIAGIPELVDSSVGWIDVDFEAALHQALQSPVERALRGSRGRERVALHWAADAGAAVLRSAWGMVPS